MKLTTIASMLTLTLAAAAPALAQTPPPQASAPAPAPLQEEQPQTIASSGLLDPTRLTGWFVAPTFGTTGFAGDLQYLAGLRGGIYLNRRFAVGASVQGMASDHSKVDSDHVRDVGQYSGLLLQYVVQSNRLVHASLETTIGGGRWCTRANDAEGCVGRNFMAFEPAANLEINVAKHMRIATGVGYRFAVAARGEGPGSRDMSSLVARTALVFGSF